MREGARRRLQQFAMFWQCMKTMGGEHSATRGSPHLRSLHEAIGSAAEGHGLLDNNDAEDMVEFETRKKSN
jgi:hypothetical protein